LEGKELSVSGQVFDIERFAVNDGPGIRTIIFLKGCNLSCFWCQNPESQKKSSQVIYYKNICRGCGRCIKVCPEKAISKSREFGLITNQNKCKTCGFCVDACFYGARKIVGKEMTYKEVMTVVERDIDYYKYSGGGVTVSGGEPLLQPDFLAAILKACKDKGIHTAIETAGAVSWKSFNKIISLLDLIFIDIKCLDAALHKKATGVDNELILNNIKKLSTVFKHIIIRIPFIPKFNDSEKELKAIFSFILKLSNIEFVEILPFNRLGLGKYSGLGMQYDMESYESLSPEYCEPFADIGRSMGLKVKVSGS
jgi:pyruvate formate lyase activating enzyme